MAEETQSTTEEPMDPSLADLFEGVTRPDDSGENQEEGDGGVETESVDEGSELGDGGEKAQEAQPDAGETPPAEPQEEADPPEPVAEAEPPAPTPEEGTAEDVLAALRQQIVELNQKLFEAQSTKAAIVPETPAVAPQAAPQQAPPAPTAPVGTAIAPPDAEYVQNDEEFEGMFQNRETFNALQKRERELISTHITNRVMEAVMRRVPEWTLPVVTQQRQAERMAEDFYKANPDLVPYKQVVGPIATQVQGQNPGLDWPALFEKVAQTVRHTLQLKAVAKKQAAAQRPALPRTGTQGRQAGVGGAPQPENDLNSMLGGIFD